MELSQEVIQNLKNLENKEKAKQKAKFFQAYPGRYGEGDYFLGLTNPEIKSIAKTYKNKLPLNELKTLLYHKHHEVRHFVAFFLVDAYQRSKRNPEDQESIIQFYLKHIDQFNNWDLVDTTTYKLLGNWLFDKDKSILYELAKSGKIWRERVAMVACIGFIKKGDFKDTFKLANLLLHHEMDIMHKAVGWMLKEVGNKDKKALETYLKSRYKNMPRTTLRYAIEKFPKEERKSYLQGKV